MRAKHDIQNLWNIAKAILKRKLIPIQFHLKKQEKSQINNLNLHQKKEQTKTSRQQMEKISEIKAELNETETKQEQRLMKVKADSWRR